MTSLPVLSGALIVKVLEKHAFVAVSQRGSHVKLRDSFGNTVIVPLHKTVARGTLKSIIRQSGISAEKLLS